MLLCFIRSFGNEVRQLSAFGVKLAPQKVWTKQARFTPSLKWQADKDLVNESKILVVYGE
jgi:hypothetical protein